jgi:hypothetical protein
MARTPMDYGIPDFSDATLRELASNPGRYGEKGKFAQKELGTRQGLIGQADMYRAALERAAYGDASSQYGEGLGGITNYLARSGPLADSGARRALQARLYSQIYGQARSRIGTGYAEYLKQILAARQGYNYQSALAAQQAKAQKKGPLDYLVGAVGGVTGGL